MDPLAPFIDKARERMPEADFRAKVATYRAAFDGLLDDEALGLLVLDELGLNAGSVITLAEAADRPEATVEVEVAADPRRRLFTRKDGSEGEVTNVPIRDVTAVASLVLWGRDGEKAQDLAAGTRFKVVNARVKTSKWGLELHHSPWTVLDVPGALSPAKRKLLADVKEDATPTSRTVEGVIRRIQDTRPFRKDDGTTGFTCNVVVATTEGEVTVAAFDAAVKAARALGEGARARITKVEEEKGVLVARDEDAWEKG